MKTMMVLSAKPSLVELIKDQADLAIQFHHRIEITRVILPRDRMIRVIRRQLDFRRISAIRSIELAMRFLKIDLREKRLMRT